VVKYVCKIEFVDLFVGKVPSNPEALVHVVRKRVKEGVLPAETNVEAEALREAYEVLQRAEMVNTFYSDEKGLYIKGFDIIGMIKERMRQLGITRKKRGYVSAVEGLRIEPWKIHLKRPDGSYVKKPDGQIAKPIITDRPWLRGVITIADYVKPPVILEFTIIKEDQVIPEKEFENILKSCHRLGGLRKEYGEFKWVKIKNNPKQQDVT